MGIFFVVLALAGLSGSWSNGTERIVLREAADSLTVDGVVHRLGEEDGVEPGSSNFLLTRLTRTPEGYHLYRESRRTTQEARGPIQVIFQETNLDYQLTVEGKLRVVMLCDNGTQRIVREYSRIDD